MGQRKVITSSFRILDTAYRVKCVDETFHLRRLMNEPNINVYGTATIPFTVENIMESAE